MKLKTPTKISQKFYALLRLSTSSNQKIEQENDDYFKDEALTKDLRRAFNIKKPRTRCFVITNLLKYRKSVDIE